MKNKVKKDNSTLYGSILITVVFLLFVAFLLEFLFRNTSADPNSSEVPRLDKSRLLQVKKYIQEKNDVDTDGKPDINKFNFGNEEPFK